VFLAEGPGSFVSTDGANADDTRTVTVVGGAANGSVTPNAGNVAFTPARISRRQPCCRRFINGMPRLGDGVAVGACGILPDRSRRLAPCRPAFGKF
jgi:hypothetical protein